MSCLAASLLDTPNKTNISLMRQSCNKTSFLKVIVFSLCWTRRVDSTVWSLWRSCFGALDCITPAPSFTAYSLINVPCQRVFLRTYLLHIKYKLHVFLNWKPWREGESTFFNPEYCLQVFLSACRLQKNSTNKVRQTVCSLRGREKSSKYHLQISQHFYRLSSLIWILAAGQSDDIV